MKISLKLCDRMDGTQFSCFPWFPENYLLCVILRNIALYRYVMNRVLNAAKQGHSAGSLSAAT